MKLTNREKRKHRLSSANKGGKEADSIHEQMNSQKTQKEIGSKRSKVHITIIAVGLLLLLIVSYSVYSSVKPSPYDDFAKCLTDKGAVIYGALDWCKYTQGQKAMFGKSFKYLNYHNFDELPGIKVTPTWVINGARYEQVQSFEKLSSLTGCKL